MGFWSAENAAKAYIRTMKMDSMQGEHTKELNGEEFISALAVGNNSQFMVVVCTSAADSTMLALAAAAQQTRGRVLCILQAGQEEPHVSESIPGTNPGNSVEFVTGDAQNLLLNHYKQADFLAIDCNLKNHDDILRSVQGVARSKDAIVLGYNAFCKQSWRSTTLHTHLLPIGEGLLLTRIRAKKKMVNSPRTQKRGRWIIKVDNCTGEEHVFRVKSHPSKVLEA
nr:uncharacterized protein LOC109193781 [Ipomoea batatas]